MKSTTIIFLSPSVIAKEWETVIWMEIRKSGFSVGAHPSRVADQVPVGLGALGLTASWIRNIASAFMSITR